MPNLQPTTRPGVGIAVASEIVTMFNNTGGAVSRGDVVAIDSNHTGGYPLDDLVQVGEFAPGQSRDPWSNVVDASVADTTLLTLIAAEDMADGDKGKFWVQGDQVFVALAAAISANGNVLVPVAGGTNTLDVVTAAGERVVAVNRSFVTTATFGVVLFYGWGFYVERV